MHCIAASQAVHTQGSLVQVCRLASSPGFTLALAQVLATRFSPSVAFLSAGSERVCHASLDISATCKLHSIEHAASLPAVARCSLQHASVGWPPEQSRGSCMPVSCMRCQTDKHSVSRGTSPGENDLVWSPSIHKSGHNLPCFVVFLGGASAQGVHASCRQHCL